MSPKPPPPPPPPPKPKIWLSSNFDLSLNGVPAAEFQAIRSPTNPSRDLLAHELTHAVQQQRAAGATAIRQWVLLRGSITRQAMMKLQASPGGLPGELSVKNGSPAQRWTLNGVKLVSHRGSTAAAGGGNAVAFETIVISHEGMS